MSKGVLLLVINNSLVHTVRIVTNATENQFHTFSFGGQF